MTETSREKRARLMREVGELKESMDRAGRWTDEGRAAFDAKMEEIEGLNKDIGKNNPDAAAIRNAVGIAHLSGNLAEDMIRRGATIDEARTEIFAVLAERDNMTRIDPHLTVGGPYVDTDRAAHMAEALAARHGGPRPSNAGREFMHMRAADMAAACLEARGVSTRGMSPNQIVTRALHTTGDFSNLLTGTGDRVLRSAYASYQGGVVRIAKESTARDFRAKSRLTLGEAPTLVQVNEHGEVTAGTMAESKTSYSLKTYARIFGLTRQAIVNDDLGAFMDMLTRFGRSAAEFVAAQLAALLTSNPTMEYDSTTLFHANHKNLGTPAVISIDSLGEALKLMRLQQGIDGVTPIDVAPKYLIVPAAKEVVAKQFVRQINATKASDVNPFTGDLDVVVDPRLDAVSAISWYLAADQNIIDTLEYSYLEDEPGPQIETKAGFEVEGLQVKCRLDFGCGAMDHRGLFKNAGA